MSSIKAVCPSGLGVIVTLSPTATGFVLLIPLRRKVPFTLQSNSWPSSVLTVYQLPVFLTMRPRIKDGLSEDLEKDAEGDMQKMHDKFIKKVDELLAAKEKEIMTV